MIQRKEMRVQIVLFLLVAALSHALGFTLDRSQLQLSKRQNSKDVDVFTLQLEDWQQKCKKDVSAFTTTARKFGLLSCILSLNLLEASAADDLIVSDLPSPWIPVVFGIVLIGGVGLLTSSLGNVIDEEAQLGMQSGARAKKEIERSRSSYFKKK